MHRHQHFALIPLLVATVTAPLWAAPPSRVRVIGPKTESPPFVGVLGAVAHPGVYPLAPDRSSIQAIIQQAGGIAEGATGNVRLVRGGKAGQQLFLTPGNQFSMRPGDVIVLDGPGLSRRSPIARASHVTESPYGTEFYRRDPQAAQEQPPATVSLAFVNVLERPVVLKVRGEHASVEKLLELLGQPPEISETVRILPTVPPVAGEPPLGPKSRLPSGTVLVFDRSTIDMQKVPELPSVKSVADGDATELEHSESMASAVSAQLTSSESRGTNEPLSAPNLSMPGSEESGGAAGPQFGLTSRSPAPMNFASTPRQLAAVPPEASPERTANKLTGPAAPSPDSLRTEFLPPPPAMTAENATNGVEVLRAPAESGSSLQLPPPPVQREVIGYSEPIDAGDRMNAQNRPGQPFNTADTTPPFGASGMATAADDARALASLRASQAISEGLKPNKPSSPSSQLASASSGPGDFEDTDRDLSDETYSGMAAVWGLFGAGALYSAWRAAKKRRLAPKPAESVIEKVVVARAPAALPPVVETAPPSSSKQSRLNQRLERLIANQMPLDIQTVNVSQRMEFFGRPRRNFENRIDAAHSAHASRPHFAKVDVVATETEPAESAPELASAPAAPVIPSGHRVDVAHDEQRSAAGGISSKPHIGDRKSDALERALANVHDAARPASSAQHSDVSIKDERVTLEGASPL